MEQLISVIIPVYNVEMYLKRCVDSVIEQNYKNMEIILVNDGSQDGSPQICDQYSREDSRIKVIHKSVNGGLANARSSGFESSKGAYVCFIDSDDFLHPDFIGNLYKICIENHCEIAECNFVKGSDSSFTEIKQEEKVEIYSGVEMISHMYGNDFLRTVVLWNKLYRRDVIQGIRYPKGISFDDEAVICEILFKVRRIGVTEMPLYYYYVRDNSITNGSTSYKKLDEKLFALERQKSFLKSVGLLDYYTKAQLRYLKQISKNYYLSSGLPDNKNYKKEMKLQFVREYRTAEKIGWSYKNRILMALCNFYPGLYGCLRKGR